MSFDDILDTTIRDIFKLCGMSDEDVSELIEALKNIKPAGPSLNPGVARNPGESDAEFLEHLSDTPPRKEQDGPWNPDRYRE